jgi:hypothetical protein
MFLAKKLNKGAGTPPPPVDAQFNYVTMLLHADGTNGAQNNTFIDSSSNAFSITRNGNTTQGSFGPFGSNWSNYFDGTGDYLNNSSAGTNFGTGSFTVECWFFRSGAGPNPTVAEIIVDFRTTDTTSGNFAIVTRSNGQVAVYGLPSGTAFTEVGAYQSGWNHVAVGANGTNFSVWINGTRVYNASGNSYNYTQSGLYIGAATAAVGGYNFNGYISNFRAVKGTDVYGITNTTITVPTAPLTAITNTVVLTCQSNRFVDNSASPLTITVNGDTSVQRFNPFGTSTAYDSSVIGGSAYLDGAGDYLSLASNSAFTVGTGNVTIEAWIYAFSSGSYQGIISGRLQDAGTDYPGLGLVINAGVISFTIFTNTSRLDDTVATPLNQWLHVVGVRSGTSAALFVNGVRKASSTNSENSTSSAMNLGRFFPADDGYYFDGYISNARIVKGTAVYDPTLTTLTVPTAPLTAVSGTSLLTSMTNGAIFDNAMIKNFETVGNAQISTSVKKYGTGSLYFDGTGDYLYETLVTSSRLSGDFTLEAWVYSTTSGSNKPIINIGDYNGSTGLLFYKNSSDELALYTGNSVIMTGGNISANTWIHVAAVRSGTGSGNVKLYLNGTSVGTPATNTSIFSGRLQVGADYYNSTVSNYFTGYMDDLRITNGYARYTATFTAPTSAFLDTGPI